MTVHPALMAMRVHTPWLKALAAKKAGTIPGLAPGENPKVMKLEGKRMSDSYTSIVSKSSSSHLSFCIS